MARTNTDTEYEASALSSDVEHRKEQDLTPIYNEVTHKEEEVQSYLEETDIQAEKEPKDQKVLEDKEEDTEEPQIRAETEEPDNMEDDDDDFGDFSDASFDNFEESQPAPAHDHSASNVTLTPQLTSLSQSILITDEELSDKDLLFSKISSLLDSTFIQETTTLPTLDSNEPIMTPTAAQLYDRLTAKPYLQPIQWKKTVIRKKLMQTLNIPDETIRFPRTKDLTKLENELVIPEFKTLDIKDEKKTQILEESTDLLESIEKYLSKDLDLTRLPQLTAKYEQDIEKLTHALSVWEDQLKGITADHETFESVIENMVGFTQRVRREEQGKLLKRRGTLRGIFGKGKG